MTCPIGRKRPVMPLLQALLHCMPLALLVDVAPASAQSAQRSDMIRIPAGSAGDALRMLGGVTGEQIAFREEDVAGIRTRAVQGRMSGGEALRRMIAGTALRVERRASGVFVITRALPARDRRVAPAALPAPAPEEDNSAIVVTGSRIRPPSDEPVSPVFVLDLASVHSAARFRAEDLIASLPFAGTEQGGFLSGQASGTATVNLRGLGSARTLLLINGKRMAPGDPLALVADVNMVPLPALKRIEVVSGGASSIYGSDAVAGVINFITDTTFEGVTLSASLGAYVHRNRSSAATAVAQAGYVVPTGTTVDGWAREVTLQAGTRLGDRGHLVAYGTFRQVDGVLQRQRDYSACGLSRLRTSDDSLICLGSSTTAPARFILDGGAGPSVTLDPGTDGFRPYVATRDSFNFAPDNHLQRPDRRISMGMFGHYDLSPALTPFVELMIADDRTEAQIAPSGLFGELISVSCANPLLSSAQRVAICGAASAGGERSLISIGRRNIEGGPRVDDIRHRSVRAILGIRGQISADWQYEGYVQHGQAALEEWFVGDLSRTRISRALDVVTDDRPSSPTFGRPVCAAAIAGADPACLPYNVWTQAPVTRDVIDYLSVAASMRGRTQERVVNAALTGRLDRAGIRSPWAEEAIGVVIGGEYRHAALHLDFDQIYESGELSGQSGTRRPDQRGSFSVLEAFGELQLPLIGPARPVGQLTLEFGGRISQYSTSGWVRSNKVGFVWKDRGLRLRGSYNRAVRAPNIAELFAPARNPSFSGWDPCAGPAIGGLVNGNDFSACAMSGVTQAQFGNISVNPARLFNIRTGGNPNLKPELADTLMLGLSVAPREIPNFNVSLDFFDIRIRHAIGQIGANLILANCVRTGSPTLCNMIHRSPANGSLDLGNDGYVADPLGNSGTVATSGLDIGVHYATSLPEPVGGRIRVALTASHVLRHKAERSPDLGSFDCVGLYGLVCGLPTPRWRHRLSAGWSAADGQTVMLTWRNLGTVSVDRSSSNAILAGAVSPDRGRFPAQNYFDLNVTAPVARHLTVGISILNLFDRDPPLIPADSLIGVMGNGNTFPQFYDPLGRFAQLTLKRAF